VSLEIDHLAEKFIAYLKDQLNDPLIDYESPLTQLKGGFETQIYRFQLKGAQKELSKPLILRLYPERYGTGNAVWESTIQNALAAEGYPVAKAQLVCTDMAILGGAFFIMDFLPGKPMVSAPIETIPELLGRTHAALHTKDPQRLIKSLREQGFQTGAYLLDSKFGRLNDKANRFPWLRGVVDWLIANRPPEPEQLAICHGDFHPLNILIKDGVVTGVLDWPGFIIADPTLDLGTTMVLATIPFKYVAPTLGLDFSNVDFEAFAEQYLDAYQAEKSLDRSYLGYYRVRRCVNALIDGSDGQKVWQHPLIVKDLLAYIFSVTGIHITMPS
jgi:aminoglycoside phosphotransferase (APT) family kinase protein